MIIGMPRPRSRCRIADLTERHEDIAADEQFDYIIQRVDPDDAVRTEELLSKGFRFHDRLLFMEIAGERIRKAVSNASSDGGLFTFERECPYTEEMQALAVESFPTDRRFHYELLFDKTFGGGYESCIRQYLLQCESRNDVVIRALAGKQMQGFIILRDESCVSMENVMGVAGKSFLGRAAALPLYQRALGYIYERKGAKAKYHGRVSGKNVPSVNLHCALGARILYSYDEYIKKEIIPSCTVLKSFA